jgi:hypothetical protein
MFVQGRRHWKDEFAYLEREVKELKKKMNEAESRNKETREIEVSPSQVLFWV